jgi:hypothetical protein
MEPWHALYLGLGWEYELYNIKNKYGIIFKDEYAFEFVKKSNPECAVYSRQYMEILKRECVRLWWDDTAYIFNNYARKFATAVSDFPVRISKMINNKIVSVFLCVLAAIFFLGFSRLLKSRFMPAELPQAYWYLFGGSVFCYFFYTIFGLIALPIPHYLLGTMISAMVIAVFTLLFIIAVIPQCLSGFVKKQR